MSLIKRDPCLRTSHTKVTFGDRFQVVRGCCWSDTASSIFYAISWTIDIAHSAKLPLPGWTVECFQFAISSRLTNSALSRHFFHILLLHRSSGDDSQPVCLLATYTNEGKFPSFRFACRRTVLCLIYRRFLEISCSLLIYLLRRANDPSSMCLETYRGHEYVKYVQFCNNYIW